MAVINNEKNIIPYDLLKKIEAVKIIINNPSYKDLFSNAKRISNILKKSDVQVSSEINENLLRESSEKILYNAVSDIEDDLKLSLSKNDYARYLKNLNTLNTSIKIFFEGVMINVEDEEIKINRLSLLHLINNHYTNLANISILSY